MKLWHALAKIKGRVWLIDSRQIFDPYSLSRNGLSEARAFLDRLKICRPFTFHQMRQKIYSLTKIKLCIEDTLAISSIDCFDDEIKEYELSFYRRQIPFVLSKLECNKIIVVRSKEWAEQFHRCGMKSNLVYPS
jgi:hypothetical protein